MFVLALSHRNARRAARVRPGAHLPRPAAGPHGRRTMLLAGQGNGPGGSPSGRRPCGNPARALPPGLAGILARRWAVRYGVNMADLLFGLETEYAIAGLAPSGPLDRSLILHWLMEFARKQLRGLPGLDSNGSIYLPNGSKFYADCGEHPEFCTPEVANPWDAVRYTQAGHRILAGLLSSVGSAQMPGAELMCFRTNVDYSGSKATWGCHESYLHRKPLETLQPRVLPHLVSRLVYAGAGGFNPLSPGLEFTLSPRVAHLQHVVSGNSTSERGIWHTKSEPLCSGHRRLHVLCGDSLCSESGAFLKLGATALVVAMADAGLAPGSAVQLAAPLVAMQMVAGDVTCKKPLRMADGSSQTALAIQRLYLELAEAHVGARFMPAWAGKFCPRWRAVLDQLEQGPGSVAATLDWGIKLALYTQQARRMGIRWDAIPFLNQVIARLAAALENGANGENALPLEVALGPASPIPRKVAFVDPLLRSHGLQRQDLLTLLGARQRFFEIDTRFGQLGPQGIFQALDLAGVLKHRVSGVDNIEQALAEPPASGRARVRGQVIQRLAGTAHCVCDWQHIVNFQEGRILDLSDPFIGEESWRPLTAADKNSLQVGGGFFHIESDPEFAARQSGLSRRQAALHGYLSGDYGAAVAILLGLLQEDFELPSTLCHLARALMMMDREGEARERITQAQAILAQADAYMVPRILFFHCLFTMFDGAGITHIVRDIQLALGVPGADHDWTILPMLDHLRPRLGETNYQFLKALGEALSDAAALPRLSAFAQWRDAEAASFDRGSGAAERQSGRRRRASAGG